MNLGGVEITPNLLLFGALAGAIVLCAIGVVAFNNPIRSALCLVVNFFLLAFVYFSLNAETLGVTQIVVYTGAIMVLFLFVIMLLNLGAPVVLKEKADWKKAAGAILGLGLFAVVGSQVLPHFIGATQPHAMEGFGAPPVIGRALFTDYIFPFEAVSILLLVGIVGSILLAKRRV
ncbi:NADH-quinone oxidoreductase subunit J [Fimbriimonas ginsengisoli]|uniref:NADH-quinone oxidoreductase subunit J n=1 Tax=Fimbriimonas ginsengisoli Gsoil 348 TaxID=661478 RepID=A0A068NKZ7_FIMGI|nr:NADH-quinone oxidoreductase subunit J [Fimbriimonas ginsengisoli]AIE84077.1 NADH-ubiquinone oxidoreductase chain J [Fimbriimonas ginsengisoli Gsoil 348]